MKSVFTDVVSVMYVKDVIVSKTVKTFSFKWFEVLFVLFSTLFGHIKQYLQGGGCTWCIDEITVHHNLDILAVMILLHIGANRHWFRWVG